MKSSSTTDQARVVERLIQAVGREPFFKAMFTENGLQALSDSLDIAYGQNALDDLSRTIGLDMDINSAKATGLVRTEHFLETRDKRPVSPKVMT